jgi:hypothetical protein
MAMRLTGVGGEIGTKSAGFSIPGMDELTECSVEESIGNISKAKDGNGDIKAVLVSKSRKTLTASGYSSTLSDAPPLEGSVTGSGFNGKIIESSMEASSEDFSKFSVTAVSIT